MSDNNQKPPSEITLQDDFAGAITIRIGATRIAVDGDRNIDIFAPTGDVTARTVDGEVRAHKVPKGSTVPPSQQHK